MSSAFERMSKKASVSDVNTGGDNTRVRLDDDLEFADFSDGEWHTIRIYPGVFATATHWIDFTTNAGKTIQLPKVCHNWDYATATFDSTKRCPYVENREKFQSRGKPGTGLSIKYFFNVLDRDLQSNEPKKQSMSKSEKESGFKDKKSGSWTPLRVAQVPKTVIEKIQKLKDLNRVTVKGQKKTYDLSDPKYGRDIHIMFDKDGDGVNKWQVQLGEERTPITEEEMNYLMWDIESAIKRWMAQQNVEQADEDVAKMLERMGGKKGKKSKAKDEDDDEYEYEYEDEDEEDDDDEVLEDDDEEDEKPSKKSKSKPASKSSKAKTAAKSKKKVVDDDDEDEDDLDDEDDDDEELDLDDEDDDDDDEPAPKKGKGKPVAKGKAKPASKSKKKVEEDEDDDDFDLDDDEDDEDEDEDDEDERPAKKSKGKPAAKSKPASKSKKKVDDDEDEDDEDFDLDDDEDDEDEDEDLDLDDDEDEEEEEPAPKKKAKPAAKKRR